MTNISNKSHLIDMLAATFAEYAKTASVPERTVYNHIAVMMKEDALVDFRIVQKDGFLTVECMPIEFPAPRKKS